ncbi:MAG: hypothetical protein OXG68_14735 [Chloroflexi bacterium]|nr:hypothetical protein [Chloroflexota bacterium]
MKNIKIDENADRLMLVEGRDDEVFFLKLLEHMGISDVIQIFSYGGKDNLKRYLLAILNDVNYSRNRRHIGIVRDADYNTNAFDSVVSALGHANDNRSTDVEFSIPPRALVRSEATPYVSVLILPPDDEGTLENLVVDALETEPIMSCVNDYFDCLTEIGISISKERRSRNKLSVFISGAAVDTDYATNRDSRRKFLREAVAMQWWRADLWQHDKFRVIKDFLTQLHTDKPLF